ncbi:unnamed protein product [Diabrotica balteata]|uniref:Sulfotransferase domain-containing protein n=1 Tax=Diabrotica balteata TaxID=107213 RepID=A0A9N9SW63_DIABA|nr:unnamed protein product [Diabrotica balteata]
MATVKYHFLTNKRKNLIFDVGVKKGGTRALLEFIRVHPDVRAAGSEVHFFDKNYVRGFQWYRTHMPATLEGQLTIEKTPSYFITREAPHRVQLMNPSTKLLVVVRDPVTRAISDYAQAISKKIDMKPFEQLVFVNGSIGSIIDTSWGPIKLGIYSRYLTRWLKFFPLSQFLFVSGERLVLDPAIELRRAQDFLGLKRVVTEKHFYFNSTKGFPCLFKSEGHSAPHCLGLPRTYGPGNMVEEESAANCDLIKTCKGCERNVTTIVRCVTCDAVFHPSCALRVAGLVVVGKNNLVKCCATESEVIPEQNLCTLHGLFNLKFRGIQHVKL